MYTDKQKKIAGPTAKKRRRRKRKNPLPLLMLAAVCLCLGAVFLLPTLKKAFTGEDAGSRAPSAPVALVDLSGLNSPYAVLMDPDSGEILASRNSRESIYPASMTKMMTALLAVENLKDLDETVTLPEDIFPKLYAENASQAGFEPGEKVVARDLLYGILLPSGAECCLTLAQEIDGSEEEFVRRMNRRAQELEMTGTHFCNTTGLYDEDHYSTTEDMALLLKYALQEPEFRQAFTSSSHSTSPTNRHPEGITFYSTMFQALESPQVPGGEILGGKTGYTDESGLCLASLASINGKEYILVTAKAQGDHQTRPYHIEDAVTVYTQLGTSAQNP